MTAQAAPHVPVLLAEVLAALEPLAGATVMDGTFGAGGYTRAILDRGAARVVAVDRDPTAVAAGAGLVQEAGGRLALVEGRFSDLEAHARAAGADAVDGVVLDIGVSSMQLDRVERGFSFRGDGPLDMRMGGEGPTAADLVNTLDEHALATILRAYGEERQAGRIARAVVRRRAERPFATTRDLADVCEAVLGAKRFGEIHPATRTFQAIRIAVNGELDELAAALGAAERLLREGGRLAVVTFHSLEDRIVKRFLADRSRTTSQGSRHLPETELAPATFASVSRAVEPGEAECEANPRARSAKLRHAVRTAAPARTVDPDILGVPSVAPAPRKGRPR